MFKHALKLIWNRRRATWLVVVEIAAAFVITFLLTVLAVALASAYRRPQGFDYENVLSVTVQQREATGVDGGDTGYSGVLEDVLLALRALPRAETVEPIRAAPYGNTWGSFYAMLDVRTNRTTTAALQAIGVELVAGRWFGPEDEGQAYRAVLANRAFAERVFGSTAGAVNQRIQLPNMMRASSALGTATEEQRREAAREVRIVGVIEEFRQGGELNAGTPYFAIDFWDGPPRDEPGGTGFNLLLKTAPGTDADFGEQVVETIEAVAPDWAASVTSWEQLRASQLRNQLLPLQAGATIAAFFIALVVMGLIGVLWQDVVRRTQEIGLRRALGAGVAAVRRQIQLETLVIGAFGILIGAIISIQFPLLQLINPYIDWALSILALALSTAAILILVLFGALYPSWLASRREPADALRYE